MKPKVMISRFLGLDFCRYDGQIITFGLLEAMKDEIDFIPLCPEADIGMGTPRETLRLIKEKNGISNGIR